MKQHLLPVFNSIDNDRKSISSATSAMFSKKGSIFNFNSL